MWRIGRRHKELDERVERAKRERELSEERLQEVRARNARIREASSPNHFAEKIRRRIIEGYDGGG